MRAEAGVAFPRGRVALRACQRQQRPSIRRMPEKQRMKLAMDLNSILKVNYNGTRIRYATNTLAGRS